MKRFLRFPKLKKIQDLGWIQKINCMWKSSSYFNFLKNQDAEVPLLHENYDNNDKTCKGIQSIELNKVLRRIKELEEESEFRTLDTFKKEKLYETLIYELLFRGNDQEKEFEEKQKEEKENYCALNLNKEELLFLEIIIKTKLGNEFFENGDYKNSKKYLEETILDLNREIEIDQLKTTEQKENKDKKEEKKKRFRFISKEIALSLYYYGKLCFYFFSNDIDTTNTINDSIDFLQSSKLMFNNLQDCELSNHIHSTKTEEEEKFRKEILLDFLMNEMDIVTDLAHMYYCIDDLTNSFFYFDKGIDLIIDINSFYSFLDTFNSYETKETYFYLIKNLINYLHYSLFFFEYYPEENEKNVPILLEKIKSGLDTLLENKSNISLEDQNLINFCQIKIKKLYGDHYRLIALKLLSESEEERKEVFLKSIDYLESYINGILSMDIEFFKNEMENIESSELFIASNYFVIEDFEGSYNQYKKIFEKLKLLEKINENRSFDEERNHSNLIHACIGLGNSAYELKKYSEAMKYLELALKKVSKIDLELSVSILLKMSQISYLRNNLDETEFLVLELINLWELYWSKEEKIVFIAESYYHLGAIFLEKEKNEKSIEYFQKALESYELINENELRMQNLQPRILECMMKLGNIFFNQKEFEKAKEYEEMALNFCEDNQELKAYKSVVLKEIWRQNYQRSLNISREKHKKQTKEN